jgi:hypothetical protein
MNDLKGYIKDLAHNVKKVLPLKDDLDKIIEREYKKAFEILNKYGIIESMYTNYKKPELEILEDYISKNKLLVPGEVAGEYLPSENKIKISKKSIESYIDGQLEFFGKYEGQIKSSIDNILTSLGYKGSISDIQNIGYLYVAYVAHNSIFLYPSYINERNKRESIAEAITLWILFHEFWHSFDDRILNILNNLDINNILNKLNIDSSTIKYIHYILNILDNILDDRDNIELRASAFEVIMYYLANGFHKDERGYITTYFNILKNNGYKNIVNPYDLGRFYGNIIVAKYRSSLEKNIYNIIDDIIHLNKEKAIKVIKNYV